MYNYYSKLNDTIQTYSGGRISYLLYMLNALGSSICRLYSHFSRTSLHRSGTRFQKRNSTNVCSVPIAINNQRFFFLLLSVCMTN